MSTLITEECINCGACARECPNTAIYAGGERWTRDGVSGEPLREDVFYIVPEKCTECVGFHEREQCAVVCPVDCCIPDPAIPESEAVLIERARQLHPDQAFADGFPSRFRGL
jgi:ferredoxin